jgi:hypothetical protein
VQQFKDTPTRVGLSSYPQILGYNEDLDLDTASILQRTVRTSFFVLLGEIRWSVYTLSLSSWCNNGMPLAKVCPQGVEQLLECQLCNVSSLTLRKGMKLALIFHSERRKKVL